MDDLKTVPFSSFEGMVASYERTNRRMWILCIILIVALLGTNAGWVYYESQFVDTEISQEIDTGEGNATVIGIGDYNGESETNSQN